MLERTRVKLQQYFVILGEFFAKARLAPTAWTVVGLVASIAAAWYFYSGGYRGQLYGGLLFLASGFLDLVDGAVARATGRTSGRGAFLDSTLDRLGEVAVYLGILLGGYAPSTWVLLTLSLSLLVSYTRARAESLGSSLSGVGIGERSERLLVLAVSAVFGYVGWGVALVGVLAGVTFVERTYRASRDLD